jgi:hypothetical protein
MKAPDTSREKTAATALAELKLKGDMVLVPFKEGMKPVVCLIGSRFGPD